MHEAALAMSARLRAAMPGGLGMTAIEAALLAEIEELSHTIAGAKAEIAAIQADTITDKHIPTATDELDAIVGHTAAATETILEVCETLDELGARLGGDEAAQLQDATMRIYEACSFQDITGQRITKVVNALKAIEAKVSCITTAYARVPRDAAPPTLLNGPQLPTNAMDQNDIDRLLADFG